MTDASDLYLGKGETDQYLCMRLANRHGLISGATGTGKTVSLQVLAEGFSSRGVPVFMADVKGDLAGISQEGQAKKSLLQRAETLGMADYSFAACPTIFWDLFGEQGHPVRATVSDMGPLLLTRLLGLNDTQEGVLNIAFKLADDEGLLLLDFKDLKAILNLVGQSAKDLTTEYGNVSPQSVGAIQRRLLVLEQQGAERFFGEPALELSDLMRVDSTGKGYVSVLSADRLMQNPRLYSTFMLWLLSELFEQLPEVGDPEKPKLVFFFDEAHLLFDDAPKVLLEKVELVARLIRSKGVGLYLVTQNPLDVPDDILGQMGNRIQHALRAFTPRDQKAVRAAAETFRANPKFDVAQTITELGVGEALVSTLEPDGKPGVVDRTLMRPPSSRLGPVVDEERRFICERSPVRGLYEQTIDRESAYERLTTRNVEAPEARREASREAQPTRSPAEPPSSGGWGLPEVLTGGGKRQGVFEAMAKSVARSIGSSLGRQIVRGILGSILKGR